MAVLQLVVREPRETPAALEILPNPKQNAPESFSTTSGHALLLGSYDLVEIGTNMQALGYQPMTVDLVDRFFTPLEEGRSEQLATPLINAMERGDLAYVRNFHESEMMRGIYVSQIRLRSPGGPVITLAQDGVLIADDTPAVKAGVARAMHMRLVE